MPIAPSLARLTPLCALLACAGAPDLPDDTEPTPTESEPAESDPPLDSEPESPTDSEPEVDSEPVLRTPPASWGAGLVVVEGPWLSDPHLLPADLGNIDPFRQPEITSGLFVDLDGDGLAEVLVSGMATSNRGEHLVARLDPTLQQLSYDAELTAAVPVSLNSVVSAYDLDGDDLPELIYANPQASLARGTGPATWTQPRPIGVTEGFVDFGGGHSAFDLDEDGWLDLMLATRSCDASAVPALLRPGGLYDRRPDLVALDTAGGRSASTLSFLLANGEQLHVALSTACDWTSPLPGFLRPAGLTPDGLPLYMPFDPTPPDSAWKLWPRTVGLPFTAVEPMGAAVADLDSDGFLDLLLALGYPSLVVLRGHGDGTFTDLTSQLDLQFPPTPFGYNDVPWSIVTPDLDHDGRPEIIVALGDDATTFRLLQGYATAPQVFWNGGDLHFVDVTDEVGMGALAGSWHGIVTDDPDSDGDADFLVGGFGSPVQMLRNDLDTGTRGLSILLRGQTSNHLGHGARVQVQVAGLPDQLFAVGGTGNFDGFGHTPVFAGAGNEPHAALVRVIWPSGFVQEVRELAAGQRHTIEEPPLLTLSPATRTAPANGSSEVTLTVRPHHPDGTPNPAAQVSAALTVPGGAQLSAVSLDAPGVHRVTVRAPSVPGSSVLTVTIDGVPLRVRPRLTWTAAP
jgi:hypothetical protein